MNFFRFQILRNRILMPWIVLFTDCWKNCVHCRIRRVCRQAQAIPFIRFESALISDLSTRRDKNLTLGCATQYLSVFIPTCRIGVNIQKMYSNVRHVLQRILNQLYNIYNSPRIEWMNRWNVLVTLHLEFGIHSGYKMIISIALS